MRLLLLVILLTLVAPLQARPLPVIDMHLHASVADENGPPPLGLCVPMLPYLSPLDPGREDFSPASRNPPCSDPIWSAPTDAAVMEQTIEVLERRNIIGVLSGPPDRVLRWTAAAPKRFIPSVQFQLGRDDISPEAMRRLFADGRFRVLGEVSNQYVGIAPDDERMRPYWALAEELDIPVAIHLGEGPPRGRLPDPHLPRPTVGPVPP